MHTTDHRKMKVVSFEYGILTEAFEDLKLNVSKMEEQELEHWLTLVEVSVTSAVKYDSNSGRVLGNVTLPGHTDY